MAIQVTGLFQHPQTNQLFENPSLELIPHLIYAGILSMDVNISSTTGGGCIGYQNIDRNLLTYDETLEDPYTKLLVALQDYVVTDVQNYGTFNPQCTYDKWDPHYVPPTPTGSIDPFFPTGSI